MKMPLHRAGLICACFLFLMNNIYARAKRQPVPNQGTSSFTDGIQIPNSDLSTEEICETVRKVNAASELGPHKCKNNPMSLDLETRARGLNQMKALAQSWENFATAGKRKFTKHQQDLSSYNSIAKDIKHSLMSPTIDDNFVMICSDDGLVVYSMALFSIKEDTIHIDYLVSNPELQSSGGGKAILRYLFELSVCNGKNGIEVLPIFESNAFYIKNGFREQQNSLLWKMNHTDGFTRLAH